MLVVMRVAGVHRMEGLIPLSVIVVIRYRNRLRNFSGDEKLLLFKILSSFKQLRRHRSRLSVFRRRWYSMKQPEAGSKNLQTRQMGEQGSKLPKDASQ